MKLVIFTPAITASAIGRVTRLVTHELVSQGQEVVVVRSEKESLLDNEAHDFGVEAIAWNDYARVSSITADADAIIYQIGDNYDFHRGCLEWLPTVTGIVCLHDYFVGNLFNAWSQSRRQEAVRILRSFYDDDIARRFFSFNNLEDFIEKTRDSAPMTEWICSMACGVVTHSSWGIERVLNSCPGPVYVCPLPYNAVSNGENTHSVQDPGDVPFRILTVGNIIHNKRVESVIRAIGNSPVLRQRTLYQLAGQIQSEVAQELSSLAGESKVHLEVLGEVDNATLAGAFEQADVVSCLRWPCLEAASASAIESMLHGKPTIVTDAGFYSELPDSCVKKINHESEIDSLQFALEQLCVDLEFRHTLGSQGQRWARATFNAEGYARNLVELSRSANKAKPVLAAVQYFAGLMDRWGASKDVMNLEDAIAPLRSTLSLAAGDNNKGGLKC